MRHVQSTASTNDDLAREAHDGNTERAVLVTDTQTAGRGRVGRTWTGVPGATLMVSVRIPTDVAGAAAAIAAVSASALEVTSAAVALPVLAKWPNDLVIEHHQAAGKLAGVLSEFVDGEQPVVIVGIGLNVGGAPEGIGATSMRAAGATVDRDDVLAGALRSLPGYLDSPETSRQALRKASATIGRRVRVDLINRDAVVGTAVDIDDDGQLVLDTASGVLRICVGDVHHLRSDES